MDSRFKGKAPSENARKEIEEYCTFLEEQEQKKQKETGDRVFVKTSSKENKDKPKETKSTSSA
jgi:hypothetical protein